MKKHRLQLEHLYKQYARPLYFYLHKLCGSEELAEDLTQETFVRATIHLHTYDGEEVRAWLFKVARNAYLDEWRKRKRRKSIFLVSLFNPKEEMISPYGVPEESLMASELNQELEELLAYLPEQYRSIIYRSVTGCKTPTSRIKEGTKILSGRSTASNGPIGSTNNQWGMKRKPPLIEVSLYLRENEEFTYKEIMDALQLSEDQVKVTLHRARKRLSRIAKQKGWDYGAVE